ncbi:MAG TPA: prephenate dehydrogenase/arogenate dehydrogenase family protein [Anaerolineales bacterium]|nr:prephenate dehydrogenase/arogenate dehydrogenase family protein [Anaerolineales bacterium]
MEDGFALKDSVVGIVGLGLMGGSLAMALQGECARLIGFDSDPATLELALAKNIVDQAQSLSKGEPLGVKVDVLILATPVRIILDLLQRLPSLISYPCIIIDIGSTKREILNSMAMLPTNFDPIGGHPICGKEKLGLENADANLFRNAPFVVAPLEHTSQRAKIAAQQIVAVVGANYVEMDAGDHDRILASTSHLPFLISSALSQSTSPEFSPLIGTGFRSTSRLAGTPSHMMMGVLQSNRENILTSIQQFCSSLHAMELALQSEDYASLEAIFDRSRASYLSLTGN